MKIPWKTIRAEESLYCLAADDFGVEVIAGDAEARVELPSAAEHGQAAFVVKADAGRGPVIVLAQVDERIEGCEGVLLSQPLGGVLLKVEQAGGWIVVAGDVVFIRLDETGAAKPAAPESRNIFERQRRLNPQGVIDQLIAQTTRQGAEIHRLNKLLGQSTGKQRGRQPRHARPNRRA